MRANHTQQMQASSNVKLGERRVECGEFQVIYAETLNVNLRTNEPISVAGTSRASVEVWRYKTGPEQEGAAVVGRGMVKQQGLYVKSWP